MKAHRAKHRQRRSRQRKKAALVEVPHALREPACDVDTSSSVDESVDLPVDVLLHEQVEPVVKVAPHVRIEMDPANVLWVRGKNIPMQFG